MSRPDHLVVVVGTGTEVGKTWVACRLAARAVGQGHRVVARKPAQSFDPAASAPTDADLLAAATGDDAHSVCPPGRWYPRAMAPPMAADALGLPPVRVAELIDELRWPPGTTVGLVETAGGVRSPLAHDADCATFAHLLQPDRVLLVADAGLGTINAVRLAHQVLEPLPVLVVLNRYEPADELHRRNHDWLADGDGYRVVTDVADIPLPLPPG